MSARDPEPDPAWHLCVLLSVTVVPLGTAALLVVMAAGGARVEAVAAVASAAVVLHVAAWWASRKPVASFAAAAGAMAVLAAVPMPGWSSGVLIPSALCFLLVLWRLVAAGPGRWAGPALGVAVVGVALTETASVLRESGGDVPVWMSVLEGSLLLAAVVGVWVFARVVRAQRRRAAERAAERLALARRSERAEIRRDLHDVIAHSLTLVVAQAEAARVGTREEATARALAQLADTGRAALLGLRGMLRVLDAAPSAADDVVPTLEGLPALVAATTTPLHRVTLTERGERRVMAADAESAVVRLVQEGITNALRHVEPPVSVAVELDWDVGGAGVLRVRVRDDGGAGPRVAGHPDVAAGSGSGLAGAERRVRAAGGELVVTPGRGWTLCARLPTVSAT